MKESKASNLSGLLTVPTSNSIHIRVSHNCKKMLYSSEVLKDRRYRKDQNMKLSNLRNFEGFHILYISLDF